MNRKFSQQLNFITDLIKTKLGNNLISIILIGGYGRDEGTFFLKNKTISLVNDIDLVIISHRSISRSILKQLMDQTAKIIKPDTQYVHEKYCPIDFHVDLFNFKKKDLSGFKPSQFSLDLKYASQVIYGNKNILRLIPELKAENISLSDGLMLLHNRALSLLEVYRSGQPEWLYYFSLKAILDSAVAILIREKQYSPFHQQRLKGLKKLKPINLTVFQQYAKKRFVIRQSHLTHALKHYQTARKILLQTLDSYPQLSLFSRQRFSKKNQINRRAVDLLRRLPSKKELPAWLAKRNNLINAWKQTGWAND